MRKKRWIILGSIAAVLAVVIIIFSTVFTLKTVTCEYRTSSMIKLAEEDKSKIIEAAGFSYGKSIFLMSFEKQKANIEHDFPYAKVQKIERKFPNKAVIYIIEREEMFKVSIDGKCYILDDELKVLSSFSSALADGVPAVPSLTGFSDAFSSLKVGDFVIDESIKNIMYNLRLGLVTNNKDISILSNINLEKTSTGGKDDWNIIVSFDNNALLKVKVFGTDKLGDKCIAGISAYLVQITKSETNGEIRVSINDAGEIVSTFVAA